jgi:DNA-binding transcriptional MerR regulator
MRIGELAHATGVSRDALRFYEERGLIRSTRALNGYREYPDEMVELVGLISLAKRLGFSLSELGDQLPALWGAAEPDAAVAALLRDKVRLVDERIRDLSSLRKELLARLDAKCPLRAGPAGGHGYAPTGPRTNMNRIVT